MSSGKKHKKSGAILIDAQTARANQPSFCVRIVCEEIRKTRKD
jgi:hypothetical protein